MTWLKFPLWHCMRWDMTNTILTSICKWQIPVWTNAFVTTLAVFELCGFFLIFMQSAISLHECVFWSLNTIWHLHMKKFCHNLTFEPKHDKTNKMTCAPSEDSDQPGHPPSLIRVFSVCSMDSQGSKASSSGQRRLWSDWADAQADLSLRWVHMSFLLVLSCSGSFLP